MCAVAHSLLFRGNVRRGNISCSLHHVLINVNIGVTYFSKAMRTGGSPPQLCLYTVSRI